MECEVAELTWENGHLAMHGLGGREKPRQGGTLESIVRQAAGLPAAAAKAGDELHPWFEHQRAAGRSVTMDALVPCSHQTPSAEEQSTRVPGSGGPPVLSSARVGSCSASRDDGPGGRKRSRAASIDVQSESQPTTAETAETADLSPDSPDNTDDHDASSSRSRPQATISTLFIVLYIYIYVFKFSLYMYIQIQFVFADLVLVW